MKALFVIFLFLWLYFPMEDVEAVGDCNRTDFMQPFRRSECNQEFSSKDYVQISIVVIVVIIACVGVSLALVALGKYLFGVPLKYQPLVE